MECNKEEAIRAKDRAEKMMQDRDFTGARRIVLKAQQLFPTMENISQMLAICDVHCSAGPMLHGEMDWYGILQVESRADDASIKKQYRKLALLLHPDKNQFAGAEAAFKLIGEAYMVLSDQSKKSIYDSKRSAGIKNPPATKFTKNSRTMCQSESNFTAVNISRVNLQQQQSSAHNTSQTFWTVCSVCGIRYQYYRSMLNRCLRCQNCLNPFVACDLNAKATPSVQDPCSNGNMEKSSAHKVNSLNQQNQFGNASSGMGSHGENLNKQKGKQVDCKGESASEVKYDRVDVTKVDKQASKQATKNDKKRKADSEPSRSDSSVANREDGFSNKLEEPVHRTNAKGSGFCKKRLNNEHTYRSKDGGPKTSVVLSSIYYPDPEFADFYKIRDTGQFAVDQIWAIYDKYDGMPRFYAQIRKVCSPGFVVLLNWLEHNPLDENEMAWTNAELPVACGNFILGESGYTEDRLIFSHVVSWRSGKQGNSFDIYPRKAEVWALYKGWNICWSSNTEIPTSYEYELVEVLSEFELGTGISVSPLTRIEHSVSLFMRATEKGMNPIVIPPNEVLRFSHYVPSYRLSGTERQGIPEGCLELDCASLPSNFKNMFPFGNTIRSDKLGESNRTCTMDQKEELESNFVLEKEKTSQKVLFNGTNAVAGMEQKHGKGSQDVKSCIEAHQRGNPDVEKINATISLSDDDSSLPPFTPAIFYFKDPQFCGFEHRKTMESFQCGQVWALYSDIDSYPKYYALVKKTEKKNFTVHVAWLDACPVLEEERRWHGEGMPIGCGTFRVAGERVFNDAKSFSHLINAKLSGKRHYLIQPNVGEVWALYKNWSVGWSYTELQNCKYDVVEICERSDTGTKVKILTKLNGYTSVFKHEDDRKAVTSMEVPFHENIRFSHRILALKLTDEMVGKLCSSCWELDPASVPYTILGSQQDTPAVNIDSD